MLRRMFITLIGVALMAPVAAAQQLPTEDQRTVDGIHRASPVAHAYGFRSAIPAFSGFSGSNLQNLQNLQNL
jgi:hypothetical protein